MSFVAIGVVVMLMHEFKTGATIEAALAAAYITFAPQQHPQKEEPQLRQSSSNKYFTELGKFNI